MSQWSDIQSWIIGDTGFLEQERHSIGVQRQYTGTAGKITNCQICVSLTLASFDDHLPVDFELYLPESWANNPARRREARIPDDIPFRTKSELALAMIGRAVSAKLPRGTVLADEAYGDSTAFRLGLRGHGLDYAVAIKSSTTVHRLDPSGKLSYQTHSVAELAHSLRHQGRFRRCSWREVRLGCYLRDSHSVRSYLYKKCCSPTSHHRLPGSSASGDSATLGLAA